MFSKKTVIMLPSGEKIKKVSENSLRCIKEFGDFFEEGIFSSNEQSLEFYNNTKYPKEIKSILEHLFSAKGPGCGYTEKIHPETLDSLRKLGFNNPISIVKFNAWNYGNVFVPTKICTIIEYIEMLKKLGVKFSYHKIKSKWLLHFGKFTSEFCKQNALIMNNENCVVLSERKFKLLDEPVTQFSTYLQELAEKYPTKNIWARSIVNNSKDIWATSSADNVRW